jgi:hypothetical protein
MERQNAKDERIAHLEAQVDALRAEVSRLMNLLVLAARPPAEVEAQTEER